MDCGEIDAGKMLVEMPRPGETPNIIGTRRALGEQDGMIVCEGTLTYADICREFITVNAFVAYLFSIYNMTGRKTVQRAPSNV